VVVPPGSYTFYQVGGTFAQPRTNRRHVVLDLSGGTFFDGWQVTAGVAPVWYASPHLELSADYEIHLVRFPDRDQRFDAHVARLRIGTALNTEVSTNAFLQYNSAAESFSANVRFRYNFREGNDLWIVYNEGLNTHRHRLSPALPLTDNRTVLVKYTYTFPF
jgi:hypothetical protein